MLSLKTTKTFATEKNNGLLIDTVFQVTPNDDETSPDWQGSIVCPLVPNRSVCMSPDEYLVKRQAELVNPQLKEAYARCVDRCDDVGTGKIVLAGFIGIVIGAVLVGIGSGSFSISEPFSVPLLKGYPHQSSGFLIQSF